MRVQWEHQYRSMWVLIRQVKEILDLMPMSFLVYDLLEVKQPSLTLDSLHV